MRVLHVNHLLDPVTGGGTAERTFQLSKGLAELGVACTILTLDIGPTRSRAADVEGLEVVAVPCLLPRFFVPLVTPSRIDALVRDADVVQLFGNWTLLNLMVWRSCVRLGKPFVFCPAGALTPFGRSRWLKRLYAAYVTQGLIRDAARCICITDDERDQLIAQGVPVERLETIPNGIDPPQYQVPSPEEATQVLGRSLGLKDAPFVLFMGRLNAIKGPDLLLEAFARIAGCWPHHLVLGGPDGGMLSWLSARAQQLGLQDRVHFPGFLGGAAKAAALSAAELLAIPSRSEAMSIVVLEAGACGCPVLFTDACGLDGLARRGAGYMVSVEVPAMSAALQTMLEQPMQRKASGVRLREIVMSEYLWSRQAARQRDLYLQLS